MAFKSFRDFAINPFRRTEAELKIERQGEEMRFGMLAIWVCVIVLAGCNGKPAKPTPQAKNGSAKSGSATKPSENGASAKTDSTESNLASSADPSSGANSGSNSKSINAGDAEPEAGFAETLTRMLQNAQALEAKEKYNEADAIWGKVVQANVDNFGADAWQTASAQLARKAFQQRSKMTPDEKWKLEKLTQIQSQYQSELRSGQFVTASKTAELAFSSAKELWGNSSHVTTNYEYQLAVSKRAAGETLTAIEHLRNVLRSGQQHYGEVHPDYEKAVRQMGLIFQETGQHELGRRMLKKSVSLCKLIYGEESVQYAERINDLGVAHNSLGQYKDAIANLQIGAEIRKKSLGADSPIYAHSLYNLSAAKSALQDYPHAIEDLRTAKTICDSKLMKTDGLRQNVINSLATNLMLTGKFDLAATEFRTLADARLEAHGPKSLAYAHVLFKLAVALGNQAKYEEAEPILKMSISIQESLELGDDKLLNQTMTAYSMLLRQSGRDDEAKAVRERMAQKDAERLKLPTFNR